MTRRWGLVFAAMAVVVGGGPPAAALPDATNAVPEPTRLAKPEWKGDKHVLPTAYQWLDPQTPIDTYDFMVVRGRKSAQALRNLGGVKRKLGRMTPDEAEGYVIEHMDPHTYESPTVAQVHRLGPALVIYLPYDFRASSRIRKLSQNGIAADFITTVNWDTYATVARQGKVIRDFDVSLKPPKKGALPEEKGLDFGAKKQNPFATAWAYIERLTRIHVTREWFDGPHPTFVLRKAS